MEATFTISNSSDYDVKDIEIRCTHAAPSGTEIDRNTRTLYDIVQARSTRTFPKVNMGFIHSQASRSGCSVQKAEFGVYRPRPEPKPEAKAAPPVPQPRPRPAQ